jgi:hypothetical protein
MFTKQLFAKSIVFFAIVLFASFVAVKAQTSKVPAAPAIEFTYQGKLNSGTVAANGTYDFKFDIYDSETGGGIVQTITVTGVTVTNGIFTVKLEVNPTTFNGDERFLEIWATNNGTFNSPMTPRQKVTHSPYAVRAKDADVAINASNANSLGGVAAGDYVQTNDTRLTDQRLPLPESNNYIRNRPTGVPQTGGFNVSGQGSAGSFNSNSYRINSRQFIFVTESKSSLILGLNSGLSSTGEFNTIIGFNAGQLNTSGYNNTFIGKAAGSSNTSGYMNTFIGHFSGNNFNSGYKNTSLGESSTVSDGLSYGTAIGASSFVDTSNTIQLGRNGSDAVRIGKLDAAGATSVCLNTSNALATCSSSIRYKNNIQDFRSGLDLIKRLRPVTFNWKADNKADMGLVAEEVNAIEPLLTTTNKDGEVEGVKYDRVGVVLVNAVNEQQDQIEAQQKEIERLKTELDSLKKLVCAVDQNADTCKPKEQK